MTAFPIGAQEAAHCIDYTTHAPNDVILTAVYVVVTCGPALISSRGYLRWFGLANLVGVITAAIVRADELTSVWCLYAAMASLLILEHFAASGPLRRAGDRPVRKSRPAALGRDRAVATWPSTSSRARSPSVQSRS